MEGFPSLSGKTFIRTLYRVGPACGQGTRQFPSLSGKTFIRTRFLLTKHGVLSPHVSIPFREDLHSDITNSFSAGMISPPGFHPFQGRPPFGPKLGYSPTLSAGISFHPFQGRPPFGPLKIHPFEAPNDESFHPFQGRPPFGPAIEIEKETKTLRVSIPFREDLHSDIE